MPTRVGIDLVSVDSVGEAIAEHGDAYLARIYTARELLDCRTAETLQPARLAARFAAKEAAVKVLRPGRGQAVPWLAIEVRSGPEGAVDLVLSGRAAALASAAGLGAWSVSLTHEAGFASAVVVADIEERPPTGR